MKIIGKIAITTFALLTGFGIVSAQNNSNAAHRKSHQNLMARSNTPNDQVKILEHNNFVNFDDNIEPEIDIYTEGWNSKRVNPFKESEVPARAVIDVRGYHMPVPGKVTSNYGYRPRFGRMHKGVDLALRSNDTVYAAFDGKVRLTNYEARGYGNYVILRHPNGLETIYGHLNRALVKPDQVVKAGQPIGLGGSTGRSTGPHLHFETRYMGYAINPSAIFDFGRHTTHSDYYTFTKQTYTHARNYAPASHKQETAASTYKPAPNNESGLYTVKAGDTISSIARNNGISKTTLLQLNGLKATDRIKVGQQLRVRR